MSDRAYSLAGRDTTGVFLGLGVGEVVLIGSGFALTILLRLTAAPVVVSAAPLLVAAAVAKVRVLGRPVWQWLPLLTSWSTATLRGRRRWRAPLPLLPASGTTPVEPPPVLRGIDVVEIDHGTSRMAAVRERRAARLTAVVPVRAQRFAGADRSTQDALLAVWGDVLAACATPDSPVVQLGWSHHATPTGLGAHRAWRHRLRGDDSRATDAPDHYDTVVDDVAALAVEHETVVWLTVSGREIAGRGKLVDRAAAALPAALDALTSRLHSTGVQVGPPLSVPELWRLLRRRCDPTPGAGRPLSLAEEMGIVGPHNGGPVAMDTTWSEVHIDGAWHRTYWVDSWPRRPMPADWLSGFLASLDSATVTVIHRPLDPARTLRRVDSQLVKLQAHRARKEDKGRRVTETDVRTEQAVLDLEADLASGHAEVLYLGLVCVTGDSLDDLDARCHTVEQAARAAQVGLRVLHGRQDVAWAASLPFGLTEPGVVDLVGP